MCLTNNTLLGAILLKYISEIKHSFCLKLTNVVPDILCHYLSNCHIIFFLYVYVDCGDFIVVTSEILKKRT